VITALNACQAAPSVSPKKFYICIKPRLISDFFLSLESVLVEVTVVSLSDDFRSRPFHSHWNSQFSKSKGFCGQKASETH
jgi:hypothetical protein